MALKPLKQLPDLAKIQRHILYKMLYLLFTEIENVKKKKFLHIRLFMPFVA